MASPAKKPRNEGKTKAFFTKQARKSSRNSIEPGDKGFLVTCNFKERDSIRECYQLLNEYYKKLNPEDSNKEQDDDEDDISSQLQDQIAKTTKEMKERSFKFVSTETGIHNLIFIKTTIDDPLTLGTTIIRDLAETKKKRTKVTLRFVPITTICKAKMEDIKDAAGLLFDKHFLKEPSTFGIIFRKRFNNDIQREEVIKELAELVALKNIGNKVKLDDPQKTIVVEIIKGNCLLSVLPDYLKLKKYNLNELWGKKEEPAEKKVSQEEVKDEDEAAAE